MPEGGPAARMVQLAALLLLAVVAGCAPAGPAPVTAPAATAAAGPTAPPPARARSTPTALDVPAIGVHTTGLVDLGLTAGGAMEVPEVRPPRGGSR